MSDVFILGAGFSKAISAEMPTLSELTADVFDAAMQAERPLLGEDTRDAFGPDIEAFLTYLATDSPWLDQATNLRQRALFLEMSQVLANLLLQQQNLALQGTLPEWLRSLLLWWNENRSWVITLNYDTLVEKAATAVVPYRGGYVDTSQLYPIPITPIGLRRSGTWGADDQSSFHLVKLHGSLNWYYSGAEEFYGETIYDVRLRAGWSTGSADDPFEIRERAVDKVPLVVPPTTSKTTFFNNETLRSQWRVAAEALMSADRHHYVGFSFPPTDQMLRFLVAPMSAGRVAAVVNTADTDEMLDRYGDAYPMGTVVADHTGYTGVVEDFVESLTS